MPHATITAEMKDILERCTYNGNNVVLPQQLDRKTYEAVNKVLVNAGGKWNRSAKAHVFTKDPREILGIAMENGISRDEQKDFQAYFSPPAVAKIVVDVADVYGEHVLEPSAGEGALALECLRQGASQVTCVEIQPRYCEVLRGHGLNVIGADFLMGYAGILYSRIVMNPPFSNGQAVKHVTHAWKFLAPGGKLVAILPDVITQLDKLSTLPDLDASFCVLGNFPERAFRESGTDVRTVYVEFNKLKH